MTRTKAVDGKATPTRAGKAPPAGIKKERKKRRYRPGTIALREIRHHQKTTNHLIAKKRFRGLVREIGDRFHTDLRWAESALFALQEGAESYIVDVMEGTNLCTIARGKETIKPRDMRLACHLKGYDLPELMVAPSASASAANN